MQTDWVDAQSAAKAEVVHTLYDIVGRLFKVRRQGDTNAGLTSGVVAPTRFLNQTGCSSGTLAHTVGATRYSAN